MGKIISGNFGKDKKSLWENVSEGGILSDRFVIEDEWERLLGTMGLYLDEVMNLISLARKLHRHMQNDPSFYDEDAVRNIRLRLKPMTPLEIYQESLEYVMASPPLLDKFPHFEFAIVEEFITRKLIRL